MLVLSAYRPGPAFQAAGSWLLVSNDSVYRASHAPQLLEFASELAEFVTREQSALR